MSIFSASSLRLSGLPFRCSSRTLRSLPKSCTAPRCGSLPRYHLRCFVIRVHDTLAEPQVDSRVAVHTTLQPHWSPWGAGAYPQHGLLLIRIEAVRQDDVRIVANAHVTVHDNKWQEAQGPTDSMACCCSVSRRLNMTTSEFFGSAAGPWSSSRSRLLMNVGSPHPQISIFCRRA